MNLPSELISQFVKATKDDTNTKSETTVYGTTVVYEGRTYVKLDGSDLLTPVSTTADVKENERVTVMIKNHTATITGNMSSPAARTGDLSDTNTKITELDHVVAEKATLEQLEVERARIDKILADNITTENLSAVNASIESLKADNVDIKEKLTAAEADIDNLEANKLDVSVATAKYATIENLEATNAELHNLEATYGDFKSLTSDQISAIQADIKELDADKLTATDIEGKYANIDFSNISKATMEWFYANSGLIENVVVGDGTITGNLVGVTIKGDLIEGNTIVADKLVIKGIDGLYYKLNTNGVTTEAEQTDQNSLNGSVIMAKSITATKIAVDDLVAFDATIGGFNITDNAIYSGVKSSVDNTTRGSYLDRDGQVAFGDTSNFIKYYKDTDGSYKLAISAASIIFAATSKSVEDTIADVQDDIDNLEIGGRNLILDSKLNTGSDNWRAGSISTNFENGYLEISKEATTARGYYIQNNVPIPQIGRSYILSLEVMKIAGVNIPSDSSAFIRYVLDGTVIAELIATIPTDLVDGEWVKISKTFVYDDLVPSSVQATIALGKAAGGFACRNIKYEVGNKPTDWTPSPEDLATAEDLANTNDVAEQAKNTADSAESLIRQLTDSISMLVTDGNGTSLMTQTDDGWTFSTAEIQTAIASAAEGLDSLTNELGDTSSAIDVLNQAVSDLGEIAEYVKIGTYEDEPCIELGEGDSEFKLRITNTQIMFMEGSNIVAHITNQALHIKKAVIEEELQQGEFVWKARSNGNLGLVWKGVNS